MSNYSPERIIVNGRKAFTKAAQTVRMNVEQSNFVCEKGNAAMWREVLVRCIPQIYGFFVKRGLHPELAEELTQKTIFDAVRGKKTFDWRRGKVESWLMGIADNNLALEMRQRAIRPKLDGDISRYLEKIDSEPLPDEILEREETAELVRKAMNKLAEKERKVLMAKYVEDVSARSIAERMNMTEKAVHSLLYRARNSLRDKLTEYQRC